jgi:sirohydrochlorin cobaltochelatase
MTHGGIAIILLGHGSRDPLWRVPIEDVAQRVAARRSAVPVRCAYLEHDTPDLKSAAQELIALGIRAITIVPMFLGVGKHAREDVPLMVESLRQEHPGVHFMLQPAIGEDVRVLDLLATIAME